MKEQNELKFNTLCEQRRALVRDLGQVDKTDYAHLKNTLSVEYVAHLDNIYREYVNKKGLSASIKKTGADAVYELVQDAVQTKLAGKEMLKFANAEMKKLTRSYTNAETKLDRKAHSQKENISSINVRANDLINEYENELEHLFGEDENSSSRATAQPVENTQVFDLQVGNVATETEFLKKSLSKIEKYIKSTYKTLESKERRAQRKAEKQANAPVSHKEKVSKETPVTSENKPTITNKIARKEPKAEPVSLTKAIAKTSIEPEPETTPIAEETQAEQPSITESEINNKIGEIAMAKEVKLQSLLLRYTSNMEELNKIKLNKKSLTPKITSLTNDISKMESESLVRLPSEKEKTQREKLEKSLSTTKSKLEKLKLKESAIKEDMKLIDTQLNILGVDIETLKNGKTKQTEFGEDISLNIDTRPAPKRFEDYEISEFTDVIKFVKQKIASAKGEYEELLTIENPTLDQQLRKQFLNEVSLEFYLGEKMNNFEANFANLLSQKKVIKNNKQELLKFKDKLNKISDIPFVDLESDPRALSVRKELEHLGIDILEANSEFVKYNNLCNKYLKNISNYRMNSTELLRNLLDQKIKLGYAKLLNNELVRTRNKKSSEEIDLDVLNKKKNKDLEDKAKIHELTKSIESLVKNETNITNALKSFDTLKEQIVDCEEQIIQNVQDKAKVAELKNEQHRLLAEFEEKNAISEQRKVLVNAIEQKQALIDQLSASPMKNEAQLNKLDTIKKQLEQDEGVLNTVDAIMQTLSEREKKLALLPFNKSIYNELKPTGLVKPANLISDSDSDNDALATQLDAEDPTKDANEKGAKPKQLDDYTLSDLNLKELESFKKDLDKVIDVGADKDGIKKFTDKSYFWIGVMVIGIFAGIFIFPMMLWNIIALSLVCGGIGIGYGARASNELNKIIEKRVDSNGKKRGRLSRKERASLRGLTTLEKAKKLQKTVEKLEKDAREAEEKLKKNRFNENLYNEQEENKSNYNLLESESEKFLTDDNFYNDLVNGIKDNYNKKDLAEVKAHYDQSFLNNMINESLREKQEQQEKDKEALEKQIEDNEKEKEQIEKAKQETDTKTKTQQQEKQKLEEAQKQQAEKQEEIKKKEKEQEAEKAKEREQERERQKIEAEEKEKQDQRNREAQLKESKHADQKEISDLHDKVKERERFVNKDESKTAEMQREFNETKSNNLASIVEMETRFKETDSERTEKEREIRRQIESYGDADHKLRDMLEEYDSQRKKEIEEIQEEKRRKNAELERKQKELEQAQEKEAIDKEALSAARQQLKAKLLSETAHEGGMGM